MNWRLAELEEFRKAMCQRFDAADERTSQELRSLRSAIQELHTLSKVRAERACPAPGSCVRLEQEVKDIWEHLEKQGDKIISVQNKVAWATGGLAAIIFIIQVVIPLIKLFSSVHPVNP